MSRLRILIRQFASNLTGPIGYPRSCGPTRGRGAVVSGRGGGCLVADPAVESESPRPTYLRDHAVALGWNDLLHLVEDNHPVLAPLLTEMQRHYYERLDVLRREAVSRR